MSRMGRQLAVANSFAATVDQRLPLLMIIVGPSIQMLLVQNFDAHSLHTTSRPCATICQHWKVWHQGDLRLLLAQYFPHPFLHLLLSWRPQLLLIEYHCPHSYHWLVLHLVILSCSRGSEPKFNTLAEVGDLTVPEAEVIVTHC
jgi:hypothetical protein